MQTIKFSICFFIFLFFILCPLPVAAETIVNIPQFTGEISYPETAITWFGEVTSSRNYTDIRMGYSPSELYVNTQVFDRLLWYDSNSSSPALQNGDAAMIYFQTSGTNPRMLRLTAQLNWWEDRANYQKIEEWNGSSWQGKTISFTTVSAWRGNAPLDTEDDRGWNMSFHIPFASLGITVPSPGTKWKISASILDKDSESGGVTTSVWPTGASSTDPSTWTTLSFGIPQYFFPGIINTRTITIRNKLDGSIVTDASVGGDTVCGDGLDFWNQWGAKNYTGLDRFNIQNQGDVADWPCYNKAYINFPLTKIPAGKKIVSASLLLHEFGNAGNSGEAVRSLIQIMRVKDAWSENTITWNNAPIPIENISSTWVSGVTTLVWPGVSYEWDVSKGVSDAYAEGDSFNIAVYSADSSYSSGKYFVSSDTEDWNETGRPTLMVTYGDLAGTSPTPTITADRNSDTKVNSMDFGYVAYSYGSTTGQSKYDSLVDFNRDGVINISDILYLLSHI